MILIGFLVLVQRGCLSWLRLCVFGGESMLVDEMSEQLKFLQGDRPEFLGNK